jgi:hypothetical protein
MFGSTRITWENMTIHVLHEPSLFTVFDTLLDKNVAIDRLQITSENKEPMSISETGFKSHYVSRIELKENPNYVLDWLNHEARKPSWKQYIRAKRNQQFTMFGML